MKFLKRTFYVFLFILFASSVMASSALATSYKHKHVRNQMPRPSLGTDFRFNAVTVHGQYESPDEGIVTVENNKTLGDLLDYKSNYKSRLAEE